MNTELPKQFEHKEAEGRIYKFWEDKNVFKAVVDKSKPPFCVVIPPPNVTGILHMGHVLDNLAQDVMVRWHRMRGYATLWVPGTDHAGIATQNVVERQLRKEGKSRFDFGREEFVKLVWKWKEEHGSIIINQLKRLGCSCDWSRERFTMDEGLSRAVRKAFVTFYKRGLIYQGNRMINWCPRCGTALANDEVEHENQKSNLWHLRYPLVEGTDADGKDYIIVATTRPETMLGDTAVAVNPDDERYKNLIGKKIMLPLVNREIPIIADEFVDPAFGTGLVKVTPAHDPNDYQMGQTHNLETITVIDADGTMTPDTGKYAGMDRFEARKVIVADLDALGFLEKIEPYTHAVGTCYRCKTAIEPRISLQWFVKTATLAEKAKKVVVDGKLPITPDSEKHDYYNWLDNIQDWCISRQLWWGHRIPIFYCDDCGEVICEMEDPTKCPKCGGNHLHQDEDVLDTWFSSQLWPFSTLGWPDNTEELNFWYPNSWLMSGRDIIFFWDVKMIWSGLELMGDIPFKALALHGLARDEKGRKLSKSLGNSPDPLGLFDQYGTDAIRASIAQRFPLGRQDIRLDDRIFQEGRAFITKLWNAARLIMMQLDGKALKLEPSNTARTKIEDKWIISRLSAAIKAHDEMLNNSDFSHAFETLTNFLWNEFCDWYLELIKPRLKNNDMAALQTALRCLRTAFKLLHPYIPFVTEELYQQQNALGVSDPNDTSDCLALATWPKAEDFPVDIEAEKTLNMMFTLIKGVRELRHFLQLPPKQALDVKLTFSDEVSEKRFGISKEATQTIGIIDPLSYLAKSDEVPAHHVPCNFDGGIAYIKLPEELDLNALKEKVEKKLQELDRGLMIANKQLSNQDFVSGAPEAVVEETRRKASEYQAAIVKLEEFKARI